MTASFQRRTWLGPRLLGLRLLGQRLLGQRLLGLRRAWARGLRTLGLTLALPLALMAFVAPPVASAQPRPSTAPATAVLRGPVVAISDGDTLTVLVEQRPVKVRLWGIDAPEKDQAFGSKAKAALAALSFGQQVEVEVRDTDRYGRTVGWIRVGGRPVNLLLVQQGMAWWYRQFAKGDEALRQAEQEAQAQRRGLWVDPAPQPPWEFRKARRQR